MTNQPWECPRCKRMNAPFNPTCFCSPISNDYSTIVGVCSECGGFYGTLQGDIKNYYCGKCLGCTCCEAVN
jgi:hypothetical protein